MGSNTRHLDLVPFQLWVGADFESTEEILCTQDLLN